MLNVAALNKAVKWIEQADSILITAGAGMGVDSGLPDFRGNEGFWQAYPSLKSKGISFTDIATPQAFDDSTRLAWGFYGHRMALYRQTLPHIGFQHLLKIAKSKDNGYFVYTSNVDNHFQKAGFSPNNIVECHGSIEHLQCTCLSCEEPGVQSAKALKPKVSETGCKLLSSVPMCKHCDEPLRPNVLMFDDFGWNDERVHQQNLRFAQWKKSVNNPIIIECGAGLAIPTIRALGEQFDAPLIRINLRDAQTEKRDSVSLETSALIALEAIYLMLGLD